MTKQDEFNQAILNNNIKLFKQLLENKNVKADFDGNVAIQNAAKLGYTDIAIILLKDSNVNDKDRLNLALKNACENNHADIVKLLLDYIYHPNEQTDSALNIASYKNYTEVVKVFINKPIFIDYCTYNNTLSNVSTNGNITIIKLLLSMENFKNEDISYNEAIQEAAKEGHLDIVELLINDNRIDPSQNRNIASSWASIYGHYNISKILFSDLRVRNTLASNYPQLYNNLIKEEKLNNKIGNF